MKCLNLSRVIVYKVNTKIFGAAFRKKKPKTVSKFYPKHIIYMVQSLPLLNQGWTKMFQECIDSQVEIRLLAWTLNWSFANMVSIWILAMIFENSYLICSNCNKLIISSMQIFKISQPLNKYVDTFNLVRKWFQCKEIFKQHLCVTWPAVRSV